MSMKARRLDMKKVFAPNGNYIIVPDDRVMTFGLTKMQNESVGKVLPIKECELYVTDVPEDLIAISASAVIINAEKLSKSNVDMMFDYYTEIGKSADETVYWIGVPEPPKQLQKVIRTYSCFDELSVELKYQLLTAYRKSRKAKDFSRKMADCIKIISLVKARPGIKTQEIAERLEVSTRTVQRYISTLQVAGEGIEYDNTKKGWFLPGNYSILFEG
ncbi:HTH domain-containing protein [Blautia sp. AF13-16]|nr:HTH domain-containing protein [Blautia sp. AF13-16]